MAPAQRRRLTTLAVMMLLLVTVGFVAAGKAHAQDTDPGDDFVDGEIVVKLAPASVATVDDINRAYGTATKETLLSNAARIYLLRVTDGEPTPAKIERMRSDARLAYAEPNYTTDAPEDSRFMRGRADSEPAPSSDPTAYSGQYAVEALNLPQAHGVNKGAGSTVAVLDTGAQLDHPELAGSLVEGYDFIGDDPNPSDEPNSVDDDGDGNTDEATGHGTHVAGVVHLTAPEAKIMPVRVLDSDGRGNVFVIAEAIQRAVDPDNDPRTDDGVDVINMSLGSSRESSLIQDVSDDLDAVDDDDDDETGPALRGVPTNGVTVVGAAGNDAAEQPAYPAAETGVIGVASVGRDEKKSEFSNYFGSPEVDVSAPGDDVYSTFTEGGYAEWDGTSMAAPFVAGQAALIRSMRPGLPSTAPQGQPSVSEFITTTARSIDNANDNTAWKGKLGAGHADVYRSTLKANTAPTITRMSPAPGSRTRDRTPLLVATVVDPQTDLTGGNVRLSIDGRRTESFSYDTNTDRLSFTARRLSYGYHDAKVTASDAQNATAAKSWRFRVVR